MLHSKAQIVATLGPASASEQIVRDLIAHQADVVRFNCSWSTPEELTAHVALVRKVAAELGRHIPIMQDLPGPRVQEAHSHTYDAGASAFTEKDEEWLALGARLNLEYAALSFVGSAEDIARAREARERHGGKQKFIAKIERTTALDHLDAIIEAADAVMVARGDLGEELPLEEVPFAQARIVKRARVSEKPVIVATQMLLSMTENDKPTRAEVTDVANAIMQGADAVMLSEETARGKYPVEAVAMMERIVLAAEKHHRAEGHHAAHYHLL